MNSTIRWILVVGLGAILALIVSFAIGWIFSDKSCEGEYCGLDGLFYFVISLPFSLTGGIYISNKSLSKVLKKETSSKDEWVIVISVIAIMAVFLYLLFFVW